MTLILLAGARRLHTIIERIVEDISFSAPEKVQPSATSQLCLELISCLLLSENEQWLFTSPPLMDFDYLSAGEGGKSRKRRAVEVCGKQGVGFGASG